MVTSAADRILPFRESSIGFIEALLLIAAELNCFKISIKFTIDAV